MSGSSTDKTRFGRRRFLAGLGIAGGSAAAWSAGLATPAAAAQAGTTEWTQATSQNGWPVRSGHGRANTVTPHRIEGSDASVAVLSGPVAAVLLHVARRFHYEIATLGAGHVHGHTTDRTVTGAYESNHLSGTAIAIRPDLYPAGARGCLFPHEVAVVRDILAECDGVVRWGGDDPKAAKEGHFHIDVKPGDARLAAVARRIDGWAREPGRGAGAPVDPFDGRRRKAALALADRQKATA
jgi:hypothetical protein